MEGVEGLGFRSVGRVWVVGCRGLGQRRRAENRDVRAQGSRRRKV